MARKALKREPVNKDSIPTSVLKAVISLQSIATVVLAVELAKEEGKSLVNGSHVIRAY